MSLDAPVTLTVLAPTDAKALYRAAHSYLMTAEEEHNLLLAWLDSVRARGVEPGAVSSVVRRGGRTVGVALSAPSPDGSLLLSRMSELEARALAEFLSGALARVPSVKGPLRAVTAFARHWGLARGVDVTPGQSERLLCLEALRPPEPVPGRAGLARVEHVELLDEWCEGFRAEIARPLPSIGRERLRALVELGAISCWFDPAGVPCSMAARLRESVHVATVSLVYTPPVLRGRGYAASCVAGLCSRLLQAGKRRCVLYADPANATANGVYERLGFAPFGELHEYVFDSGE